MENKFLEEEREEAFTVINTKITEYWGKKLLLIMAITIGIRIFTKRSIPPINIENMEIIYIKVLCNILIILFQILNFILTLFEVILVFLAISLIRIKNLPKEISTKAKIYYVKPIIIFYFCFLLTKAIAGIMVAII